jgi:tetratricopeptide (TPR) repeat protein
MKRSETRMIKGRRQLRFLSTFCIGHFLVFGLALSQSLHAQEPTSAHAGWIGERVVQKAAKLTLRMNDEPLESNDNTLHFYRVEQVDGASLLLKPLGQGKSGWASAAQMIRVEEALNFFSREIRRNARDPFSFAMMGLLEADKNEHDLAIRNYDTAIRLDPRNAASYTGRAGSWYAKKEHDKAVADYDAAILLDSKNTVAYIGRGLTRAARNEYTQAVADFSEAIWLDPLSTQAYRGRGRAWLSKNEYAKAIVDYNMAVRLDPEQAAAHRERGNAWEAQKSYRKALADYGEAIRIDPRDAQAYCDRARLLTTCPDRGLRDAKLAVVSATNACELSRWEQAGALDSLAAASAATGDFESAVKWQTKSNALVRSALEQKEGKARLERYREKRPEP